jgi:fumarate hydratase subunit alpha
MRAVLDVVEDTMGEACPPVIISIGIGGTSDVSTYNAKKGLFRTPFGASHPDPLIAQMEREILSSVNNTKLGPMGFGGNNYALALNIEIAGTHTSIVPITVTFQCWADRYASARIYNDGRVEYISHPDALEYL